MQSDIGFKRVSSSIFQYTGGQTKQNWIVTTLNTLLFHRVSCWDYSCDDNILSSKLVWHITRRWRKRIKDAQATGEAFSPQKRTFNTSNHENSLLFSIILGHFCPARSGSAFKMWIQIQQLKWIPRCSVGDPSFWCRSGSRILISD